MEAEGVAAIVVNSGDLCRGCLCFSQVNTGTNTQLLSRSLSEGTLSSFFFHPIFQMYRIVLFIFPFQTWKNTAACVHPTNQS